MSDKAKEYISVKEWAEANSVSERSARYYCAQEIIAGAFMIGKTWNIPVGASVTKKKKAKALTPLIKALKDQKQAKQKGGIYHRVQIDFTYNSNHIEGSRLTHDQTRYIFETNTIGITGHALKVDDIIETTNHFRAIDSVIETLDSGLTEAYIKRMHSILKTGTSDSQKEWFGVGEYKKMPNEVGGMPTTSPDEVHAEMRQLLADYNARKVQTFEDILDFHKRFESIHPFQDGNGRVGRLIMFRECLRHGHVPFIITDDLKMFYYNGLRNWPERKGDLMDTCLTAQDAFKRILDYFRIKY